MDRIVLFRDGIEIQNTHLTLIDVRSRLNFDVLNQQTLDLESK